MWAFVTMSLESDLTNQFLGPLTILRLSSKTLAQNDIAVNTRPRAEQIRLGHVGNSGTDWPPVASADFTGKFSAGG